MNFSSTLRLVKTITVLAFPSNGVPLGTIARPPIPCRFRFSGTIKLHSIFDIDLAIA